jgi:ADP-heptose:LPS heptosyltransferase
MEALEGILAFGIFISVLSLLFFYTIATFFEKRRMTYVNAQLAADKLVLEKKINELVLEKEKSALSQNDGFVKFISQSREKAFEYIEDVQASLYELKLLRNALESELKPEDLELLRNTIDNVLEHLPSEDGV